MTTTNVTMPQIAACLIPRLPFTPESSLEKVRLSNNTIDGRCLLGYPSAIVPPMRDVLDGPLVGVLVLYRRDSFPPKVVATKREHRGRTFAEHYITEGLLAKSADGGRSQHLSRALPILVASQRSRLRNVTAAGIRRRPYETSHIRTVRFGWLNRAPRVAPAGAQILWLAANPAVPDAFTRAESVLDQAA